MTLICPQTGPLVLCLQRERRHCRSVHPQLDLHLTCERRRVCRSATTVHMLMCAFSGFRQHAVLQLYRPPPF